MPGLFFFGILLVEIGLRIWYCFFVPEEMKESAETDISPELAENIFVNTKYLKQLRGKLCLMLEARRVWSSSGHLVAIRQGAVVMILDADVQAPSEQIFGKPINEKNYLHWLSFKAKFQHLVLYEDKILKFTGRKTTLTPNFQQ